MCGIAAVVNSGSVRADLERMIAAQSHRGPDANGMHVSAGGRTGLGHNRLTIIDRSDAGLQPMSTPDGRLWMVFNGEIYNYRELRAELDDYPFRGQSDSEVLLAAYERWGRDCLSRFIGMFAFVIWSEPDQELFAARDRFGVKPLVYTERADGALLVSSEIKALQAAGGSLEPDETAWATYFTHGLSDHSHRTFWRGVSSLPPGHSLTWRRGAISIRRWYDFVEQVGAETDGRSTADVIEEYTALLEDSVRLRFRSDVPVGITLSGGLDSSTLLAAVDMVSDESRVSEAFTFVTGDPQYDELPWVRQMLAGRPHPLTVCPLSPQEVPQLALSVQSSSDEPFGGIPTLAYAKLFECARADDVIVLLDGQGMDEQWAGYSYYATATASAAANAAPAAIVQGAVHAAVQPDCLVPEFRDRAEPFTAPRPFNDPLRDLQYRDLFCTKLQRALRFNDRISMRSSIELREPFLDHRLVELAVRQPESRKIVDGSGKWLLRQIAKQLIPGELVLAPKRPVQTPQREWLAGPLRDWADAQITDSIARVNWLDGAAVRRQWDLYCAGASDNSFYVWQWISLGLIHAVRGVPCASV